MTIEERLASQFAPILAEVEQRSSIAGSFIDKDRYRLFLATMWANIVMDPNDAGIEESDLEPLHNLINNVASDVVGDPEAITACFEFINSKPGEVAMNEARLTKTHKDLLLYFSSMILDPEGHQRWMDDISKRD